MQTVKYYYTNARLNKKTALLVGPFYSVAEAEACIDLVIPVFTKDEPLAINASFGVLEVSKHAGLGVYNAAFKANGFLQLEVPQ